MSLPRGTPPGSPGSPSPTDWGDDIPVVSIAAGEDIVPTGFDEAVLRNLCELDCGVPLLLDRIKQSMVSCREASIFFRKRAALEDEFGRGLYKLARTTSEVYAMNDGKAGSFVSAWSSTMKIHEIMGESHIRFAQRLAEMSDELASLAKEVEKNRKSAKDLGTRYERALQDAEAAMEKAKARVSAVTEELERVLVAKEGETMKDAGLRGADGRVIGTGGAGKGALGKAVAKGGALLKGKPASLQLQKQEEDIRARLSMASDGYRQSMLETQKIRQEYFNFQLPRILRSLKECADEIDLGTQYHLSRYAFLLESTILTDGATLCPMSIEDGPGIKLTIESIDNRTDFKLYMQNYAVAHGAPKGPRREGPAEDGFLPPLPTLDTVQSHVSSSTSVYPSSSTSSVPSSTPTYLHAQAYGPTQIFPPPASLPAAPPMYTPSFGIPLAHLVVRDGTEQPRVLTKCAEAIEKHGLDSVGIYRLSGTTSRVRELRSVLDKDIDNVDLDSAEWTTDINNITSVLKMWFRELPEPLLTWELYTHFVEAAQIEGDRLRSIRLHEHVNALPDANYSTLKYLMGHLYRISEREHVNQMSRSNLAIVFGPTLLGARREDGELGASVVQDTSWQCKAIETILDNGEHRPEEEGYWDAIGEEEEGPHLFWVPAHLHPEIAPSEFRAFLKEHARAASDEGHEASSEGSEESHDDKPLPFPGPARSLSTGVTRKKSMLSRQYRGNDTDEEPVRRSRGSIYGGPQLTINDLQKIDELAQDADPAKLRAVLRRSLSLNVAPSFLDKADALPDNTDEADSPIIVPRPGQILRRAARTKIRKPNLPGDGGGHRFASTRRAGRTNSASAVLSQDDHRSESDHTTESEPHAQVHAQTQTLAPPEDDWHSDRPLSYTDESTIFDAYADRRDSMTSLASDEAPHPTSLDLAIGIAAPAVKPHSDPEPPVVEETPSEPELYHPAPQRPMVSVESPDSQRTPSPPRSQTASPASSDLHLPPSQTPAHPVAPGGPARKERKGGLFGMGKKSKKDKDSEKDTGFFGSLFGGGKSKKPDDSTGNFAGGQAAAAALLGASKSKSPAPPHTQAPNQPPIQPSANGTYARYPIHVERAVYRLSHIKLANPRRPLYEQVLISNLMFWYLGVINKQQQEEKERAAEKEREEREKKDKEKDKDKGGKSKPGGNGRKAEMAVRGPQYEMQNRQASGQFHLPARQQRVQSAGEVEFGYTVGANGGAGPQGLPPGAMAPQATSPSSQNIINSINSATYGGGGGGPYPPMSRPKSAGKGSSGSMGSRKQREGSEEDTPLNQLGGSLGRKAR
ncbi:GTPase-activator protein for Rho-like GTPase family protein [Rhizoctonia solani AG-3 Rhs1AP]|uniref:GTPase-activator protein for Rho-like GTPase family protein n=1 Tax=Rhizoctonia solani AG-3 Rhs1AP TaxID=1086054 RepID=X8IZU6_9AGAM|nr:GTPase-activator protein for Rho-like GTPase family protein [Rhizoctonia solani AG-3 Rhs1AP]